MFEITGEMHDSGFKLLSDLIQTTQACIKMIRRRIDSHINCLDGKTAIKTIRHRCLQTHAEPDRQSGRISSLLDRYTDRNRKTVLATKVNV